MGSRVFARIGRIVRTHGLTGEVSIVPAGSSPLSDLVGTVVWFVPPPFGPRSARITSVRPGSKGELVAFEGVDSVTEAEPLCGTELLVRMSDLPHTWIETALGGSDLTGYAVSDVTHGELGHVTGTIVTGANDVLTVAGRFGEVLIPVIDEVVIDVDDEARLVRVDLLDGLLPGEGNP